MSGVLDVWVQDCVRGGGGGFVISLLSEVKTDCFSELIAHDKGIRVC